MKLFGKELFAGFKEPNLYDFAQHGILAERSTNTWNGLVEWVPGDYAVSTTTTTGSVTPKKKAPKNDLISPKRLFQLKALNEQHFAMSTEKNYLDETIADCKTRIAMLPKPLRTNRGQSISLELIGAESFGRVELLSMVERLENRRKIHQFDAILEDFPHTTTARIQRVLQTHKHLEARTAGQFVPDFPKEAMAAMKRYNAMCQKLCGKDTNFYVIANKKDFEQVARRRDPILLAQSPFGFFWQILGAWDEEMQYLGDL